MASLSRPAGPTEFIAACCTPHIQRLDPPIQDGRSVFLILVHRSDPIYEWKRAETRLDQMKQVDS